MQDIQDMEDTSIKQGLNYTKPDHKYLFLLPSRACLVYLYHSPVPLIYLSLSRSVSAPLNVYITAMSFSCSFKLLSL